MNICKFYVDLMLNNLDVGGRNTLTVRDLDVATRLWSELTT